MTTQNEVQLEQGVKVYVLRNQEVELAVVPELGARIISLKNLRTGREWLWRPQKALKLFRNNLGDDFSSSTLTGVDECFPTIAPCVWKGRKLPDHGEVWSVAWRVDPDAWKAGVLKTSVALAISPFEFERTIELRGNVVLLSYHLHSRGVTEEKYLWAVHPLLSIQPGDRLSLPPSTRAMLRSAPWIDAVDSVIPEGGCVKTFAGPVKEGRAGVINQETGDGLIYEWNPAENNTLGLWLTRGGWHGYHHLALEPTNGCPDPLTTAAEQNRCGTLPAGGSAAWSVALQIL